MKVMFLDFDGVLGPLLFEPKVMSYRGPNAIAEQAMHTPCWARVRQIIDTTGCKVVLSTSWRETFEYDSLVQILLETEVIPTADTVIGVTPALHTRVRGDEILSWLKAHRDQVTNYVILDDLDVASHTGENDLYCHAPHHGLSTHHVRTPHEFGIQDDHVEQAIQILSE